MTYRSRPERKGYRLTEEGENLYAEWLDMRGCSCHTGCAPCSTCTHEGHPISLEETDEVWEPEFTEYLIDYTDEYGLPTCAIGCAAGSGFCVESCQHFEKVEKCGAGLERIYCKFIEEIEGGNDVSRSDIVNVKDNGDSVPETKKEFKVGYWYKCIDERAAEVYHGKYYKLNRFSKDENCGMFDGDRGECFLNYLRFDVNSESSFDPEATPPFESNMKWDFKTLDNVSKQTEEKQTMSNANNRRIVTVQVFDLDPALDVEHSLVHVFEGVVTEEDNSTTLTELLHTGQLVEPLAKHNKTRTAQDNKDILSRTGKKVKLEAIKVKNLHFKYV